MKRISSLPSLSAAALAIAAGCSSVPDQKSIYDVPPLEKKSSADSKKPPHGECEKETCHVSPEDPCFRRIAEAAKRTREKAQTLITLEKPAAAAKASVAPTPSSAPASNADRTSEAALRRTTMPAASAQTLEVTLSPPFGPDVIVQKSDLIRGQEQNGKKIVPSVSAISSAEAAEIMARVAGIDKTSESTDDHNLLDRFGAAILAILGLILILFVAAKSVFKNPARRHELGPEAIGVALRDARERGILGASPGRNGRSHPSTASSSESDRHSLQASLGRLWQRLKGLFSRPRV